MNLHQTGELANKAAEVHWVQWVHPYTMPAKTALRKKLNVIMENIIPFMMPAHCAKCLNMNGCCFAEDKCPESPLHDNCHCKIKRINGVTVTAECPIEKFTGYIFSDKYINNGKNKLYRNWGFTITDSNLLKAEMEKQAINVYLSGEYILGEMNSYGQRIDIPITLNCKNGQRVTFKTGWMTYPNGKIILITPYGGKIK